MIYSHLKITCYFHMWKNHHCYGYIINHALHSQKYFSEMVWHFIGVLINKSLHGQLEIQNFSSRVEKYLTRSLLCTAPEMIPTPNWSPPLQWSPNRPWNDTDPEMIPISLHVDPKMIPMEWYPRTMDCAKCMTL